MTKSPLSQPPIPSAGLGGTDQRSVQQSLEHRLVYSVGKDNAMATPRDWFYATAYTTRDHLIERWMQTMRSYYVADTKRVYYLSMEFLMGRTLMNSLLNLSLEEACSAALKQYGVDIHQVREMEPDAALGNGGLGRLAACFLDSMATLNIPGYGYGIRYEYGMFRQGHRGGRAGRAPRQLAALRQPLGVSASGSAVPGQVSRSCCRLQAP